MKLSSVKSRKIIIRQTGRIEISSFKDIQILARILEPLLMALSRGHTGQIKRTVVMR